MKRIFGIFAFLAMFGLVSTTLRADPGDPVITASPTFVTAGQNVVLQGQNFTPAGQSNQIWIQRIVEDPLQGPTSELKGTFFFIDTSADGSITFPMPTELWGDLNVGTDGNAIGTFKSSVVAGERYVISLYVDGQIDGTMAFVDVVDPAISLISPNSDELVWHQNDVQIVKWIPVASPVSIYLKDGNGISFPIVDSTDGSTGNFLATIPADLADGQYQAVVETLGASDAGEPFRIEKLLDSVKADTMIASLEQPTSKKGRIRCRIIRAPIGFSASSIVAKQNAHGKNLLTIKGAFKK